MNLDGQTAIVTGGGRGLGRGICLCLAKAGANIVVADILIENAQKTAEDLVAMGRKAIALQLDVTKPDEVTALVKTTLDTFGQIDILVNNAGVVGAPGWQDADTPRLVDWDSTYEVNLKALVICSEAVLPHMKERRSGKIVNISSIGGRKGLPHLPHYCASKAGCISYTQSLAQLVGPYNVRVNAVCPDSVPTPLMNEFRLSKMAIGGTPGNPPDVQIQQVAQRVVQETSLGREQTPEDIGNAVCFFVSDLAKNISGQTLNVSGGRILN